MTPLADRLRANLRAAGISAPDAHVDALVHDGSLSRMEKHLAALRGRLEGVAPDYIAPSDARVERPWPADAQGGRQPPSTPSRVGDDIPSTVAGVAPLVRAGTLSPVELVERSLARIADRDGELNAFQLVLDAAARAAARTAEEEIRGGAWRGPLHGVPVAVKDLFRMAGTVTTAGGKRPLGPADASGATAVERLQRAGAIIVGKTRLPEFAFWPGSMNPHYGPTANPRDPSRDAGGSSSGSAAAVADGMVHAAIGSDTGGSIRIPAALCGIVGLKPTYGRVSLEGCVPLAWSLDHAGPLTRSVDDAAIVLDVLLGGAGDVDVEPAAARGLRVAALRDDGTGRALGSDDALAGWRRSLRSLEAAGAELVELDLPEMAPLRAANFLILSVEAATYHSDRLRERYADYGEPCRSRLLAGFAYDGTELVQAQRFRRLVRRRWSERLDGFDVLATPSQPHVAPGLGEMASVKFTSPFNALGWPAVSVPFGTGSGGLPVATQLVSGRGRERTLLSVAQLLEGLA